MLKIIKEGRYSVNCYNDKNNLILIYSKEFEDEEKARRTCDRWMKQYNYNFIEVSDKVLGVSVYNPYEKDKYK